MHTLLIIWLSVLSTIVLLLCVVTVGLCLVGRHLVDHTYNLAKAMNKLTHKER